MYCHAPSTQPVGLNFFAEDLWLLCDCDTPGMQLLAGACASVWRSPPAVCVYVCLSR